MPSSHGAGTEQPRSNMTTKRNTSNRTIERRTNTISEPFRPAVHLAEAKRKPPASLTGDRGGSHEALEVSGLTRHQSTRFQRRWQVLVTPEGLADYRGSGSFN